MERGPGRAWRSARLESSTGIGTGGNPVDTSVETVAAEAGSGSAYLYETDAVAVGSVGSVAVQRVGLDSSLAEVAASPSSLSGVTAGTDAKVETIGGTLTVDDAVAGGQDVLLAAGGVLARGK